MRKSFCDAMLARVANDASSVFLTGDLGFMALEPVREAMGKRFVNAGVAEQNMVSMAAAMASEGLSCWTYSIAPFLYARAFEQIRVDLAFHGMPVKLVGNGGGFGYGVQGPTHHAVEDYGTLLGLPSMTVYLPCTDGDVVAMVGRMHENRSGPAYLRLGIDESRGSVAGEYQPWRKVMTGDKGVAIGVGGLAGAVASRLAQQAPEHRPELWICGELPLAHNPLPKALLDAMQSADRVYTIEEHVRRSGLASEVALVLAAQGRAAPMTSFAASSQMISHYGSQAHMRKLADIDPEEIVRAMAH